MRNLLNSSGILLAMGRFYRDSEMTALFACGVGYISVFRPAMLAGVMGVFLIFMLTIWINPWAAQYEQQLKAGLQDRSALDFLTAGKFVETNDGSSVIFIQSGNAEKTQFEKVFVHRQVRDGSRQVEIAKTLHYQKNEDTDQEYIIFSDGQSTTGKAGSANYTITQFKHHGVLIPRVDPAAPRLKAEGMDLGQLWKSRNKTEKAELQWRISIPLASLILALLAVPISHTSPRQGRFAKLAIAILIYIPYSNLLVLARKWIADCSVSPLFGMWWVHLLVCILLIFLIINRLGWGWVKHLIWPNRLSKLTTL